MNYEQEISKLNRKWAMGIIGIEKYEMELHKLSYLKKTAEIKKERKKQNDNAIN